MSQYRKILLIADREVSKTPALERAAALAHRCGAALHIAAFDYHEGIAALRFVSAETMAQARDAHLAQTRSALADTAAMLNRLGIAATTDLRWSRTRLEDILDYVRELAPDLVVKDTRLEPVLKRVLFTPLDWQLMRSCPAPLLLVHNAAHAVPRKVYAAVNPLRDEVQDAALDDAIIRAALALAIQCDAQLHLVHVFDSLAALSAGPSIETPMVSADIYELMQQVHSKAFGVLADAHGVPPECRHLLEGSPARVIAELAAEDHADVIVLGAEHRGALERFVMGSTAEHILDAIPCSVLAVKPAS